MKISAPAGFALIGGVAGAAIALAIHPSGRPPVVHAQDQFSSFAGCVSAVPKAWGSFVGASSYGLAFQDDKGTVRFVQHPVCGNALNVNNAPIPDIDLEIVRR